MELPGEAASFYLSESLNINAESTPPLLIFKEFYKDPQTLTEQQKQEWADFGFRVLLILENNNPKDTVAVEYIGKLLLYYCLDSEHFKGLSSEGQESILSFYNEAFNLAKKAKGTEVLKKAIEYSRCSLKQIS
jgi:hypothetical protein